ncbi:MAG: prolipoprotein diacylglyceryl transferase [Candidatus Woesearchaeota archaeon]|nr:MAG: prolipoprotein diacylglyceryl transferase [Candidatus Woesearchaeota archaeon]
MVINPVLIDLGPLQIRWYGVLLVIGLIIGIWIFNKLAKERGINEKNRWDYIFWMIIGIFVGARLFHVFVYNFELFLENPLWIFYIWQGGISSHGAIIGGIITTLIFSKMRNINFYDLIDNVVVPAGLVGVFIRIGNFINVELVGRVTDVAWAVKFEDYEGLRHPSQFYQAFKDLVIFGIMLFINSFKPKRGVLFWSFIVLFSLFRFTVEFYKDFPLYLGLTPGQLASIPFFIVGVVMLYKINMK